VFCSQCGARLRSSTRFCEECGTPRGRDAVIVPDMQGKTTSSIHDQDAALAPYQAVNRTMRPGEYLPPLDIQMGQAPAAQMLHLNPRPAHLADPAAASPAMPSQAINFNLWSG